MQFVYVCVCVCVCVCVFGVFCGMLFEMNSEEREMDEREGVKVLPMCV